VTTATVAPAPEPMPAPVYDAPTTGTGFGAPTVVGAESFEPTPPPGYSERIPVEPYPEGDIDPLRSGAQGDPLAGGQNYPGTGRG
jgi:hypothetical protein